MKRMSYIATGCAAAVAGVAALTVAPGNTAHAGPPAPKTEDLVAGMVASQLGEKLRPQETRLTGAVLTDRQQFGDQTVVVAHGNDAAGKPRTFFAVMQYEDGIGWYPATTVDRPNGDSFAWAELALADGRLVLTWDHLPVGSHVEVRGKALASTDASGFALTTEPGLTDTEVVVR